MKIILAFLITLPAYSNTFKLRQTGARFTLDISPEAIQYESEAITKFLPVKKCNEVLVKTLNSELLADLPGLDLKSGLDFEIDNIPFFIDPDSAFTKNILMMDSRIQRFLLDEKALCN
jgi:hypothetical protein